MTDKKMMRQVGLCREALIRIAKDYHDGADLRFGVVDPLVVVLQRTLAVVQAFDVSELDAALARAGDKG